MQTCRVYVQVEWLRLDKTTARVEYGQDEDSVGGKGGHGSRVETVEGLRGSRCVKVVALAKCKPEVLQRQSHASQIRSS